MLLKNWHWRPLKSESALMQMMIWDRRSLKSKSAWIYFVKATGTHTNDAKVFHDFFVAKIVGSLTNNAKALNETFFAEVTDSNPVWEWTQQFNPELSLEWKAVKGTQADIIKLCCFGPCQLVGWVFDELVLSLWISLSCPWLLNITPFDERLPGSNASCPNHLVGLQIGSHLGSFVGSLIGCYNWIKWMTQTWSPATKLTLVSTFAWLSKRKSVNSTKYFKRAGIASILFVLIADQWKF